MSKIIIPSILDKLVTLTEFNNRILFIDSFDTVETPKYPKDDKVIYICGNDWRIPIFTETDGVYSFSDWNAYSFELPEQLQQGNGVIINNGTVSIDPSILSLIYAGL